MKALVVYYSRSGRTKKVAEAITKELGCDSEEIIGTEDLSGLAGMAKVGELVRQGAKIRPLEKDPSQYDLVIIGTPVWGSKAAAPVKTYILENKPKLPKIAFFLTMGGIGAEATFKDMEALCGKAPAATLAVRAVDMVRNSYVKSVKKFVGGINV